MGGHRSGDRVRAVAGGVARRWPSAGSGHGVVGAEAPATNPSNQSLCGSGGGGGENTQRRR